MDSCRRKSKERIGIWIYSIRILVLVNKGGGDRKRLGTVWGDILAVVRNEWKSKGAASRLWLWLWLWL
jgi:hypothetical protein